jgi:serine/threonine protein kinase
MPLLESRLTEALASHYTIEGEIGRGGMGIVFKARDEKLKRPVAIKVLPPELAFRTDIRQRFLREAETAARLAHPHIVPIHSVGEVDTTVYFVMGLVEGESLAVRIKRRGRLSIEEARRVMKEAADALAAAHQQGVIHRDVKPDNILLEGTRGRVMVTDFGIAKALTAEGGTLTEAGVAIGTPAFMSPEQASGEREIDGRSDIYSLGVVAYQMLTGELPFQAPSVAALLMKQISERPVPVDRKRPETPIELSQTVMRCLEKEAEDRWPSADALRRALESGTYTAPPPRQSPRGSRRPAYGTPDPVAQPALPRRMSDAQARDWLAERGAAPQGRPSRASRRSRKLDEKEREEREIAELARRSGEPVMITRFRHQIARYAAVNGMLLAANVLTTQLDPPWALFPIVFWGFSIAKDYARLWTAGYSWRDVVNRPPAPDAFEARLGTGRSPALSRAPLGAGARAGGNEFGSFASQVEQARSDRAAVVAMLERMSKSERKMLPEIGPTVDQLMERIAELGRSLASLEGDIDQGAVEKLDARISEAEREEESPDQQRRLALLRQQHDKLGSLVDRRSRIASRFDACIIQMQNVRFDLLRLRSAGVGEALGDLTQATQQARALSRDVDAVIDAAGEVRRLTGQDRSPPPPERRD